MSTKKNISPSVDEAKLRIELYNKLSRLLMLLKRDEVRTILSELDKYVKLMQSTDTMKPELMLMYFICVKEVYHYLYKLEQLGREGYDAAEPYKHINDIFTTILKEHDAD
jgi:hypothetical protein